MDTIYAVNFYFLCYLDDRESTYLFSLSIPSCCSRWTLYVESFSINSATRITVCLLIYFPFPLLPAVLYGHYRSSHFLFPLLLGSQCVYLFIFPFFYFLLFCMDTIGLVIFHFLSYSDHRVSTYLFPFPWLSAVLYGHYITSHFLFPLLLGSQCVYLFIFPSFTSCSSGWTLYILLFSMSAATWITVSLFIYFSFPLLPAVRGGHNMSCHFLFSMLLGSQWVYILSFPFLDFLRFWMDTIYPVVIYFLCYSDHSVSTYLFSLSIPSCCSRWTLYVESFSINSATRITVCLLIYFPFLLIPAVLYGHYRSSHFLFPLLLESQCAYLFIFPFLYLLLFWIDTICPVIFYCLCYSVHSVSTYLFPLSFTTCSSIIFYFLCYSDHSVSTYLFSLSFTSCCSGWTLYGQ